jgi:hypothetical protein
MTINSENSLALLAFNIGVNQFDINRGLAYISMRDQVLRARTLIAAAKGAELFELRAGGPDGDADEPVDYDVTVLGAGVGGISIALAAVEKNLRTLVIDKNDRCFALLRSGTDRLVSTTVYDWPARHFDAHAFPQLPGITSLKMKDDFILKFPDQAMGADQLACHLLQFAHGVTISDRKAISLPAGRCVLVNSPTPLPRLHDTASNQVSTRIVVYAFGFGSEKVMTLPAADINASFWGYRTLEADLNHLGKKPGRGLVSIQGAGDGGLQEALRFAFGPAHQDLALVVAKLEATVTPAFAQWEQMLRDVMLAEDNAARAYMWGYSQELVFETVERAHQTLVDALLATVPTLVAQWYDTVGRKQDLEITVYDTHAFSGRVYALNRFLFKLVLALTTQQPGVVLVSRVALDMPEKTIGIKVNRSGLAQIYRAMGTGSKADYLRRATLRAIPNQYGIVG